MTYSDQASIENYLQTTIDGTFSSQLASWIAAMSRYMDGYCGCTLVDTAPTVRLFDGQGACDLKIDDVNTVTAVTVSGTTVTPLFYPANTARKYLLRLQSDVFPVGMQNVSVAGIFARFTALPEDIKFACTVLAAGIVNQSNKQTDGIQMEMIGEYKVIYTNPKERADYAQAMQILNTYRKITF